MSEFGTDGVANVSEAAHLMGVCSKTIRDWCDQGKIPHMRHDNNHRGIDRNWIREYLRKREQ